MGVKRVLRKSILKLREKEKNRLKLDQLPTGHGGLVGLFETMLRRWKTFTHAACAVPLYVAGAFVIGCALFPAFTVFHTISEATSQWSPYAHLFAQACATGVAFYTYGFTLIFLLPTFNFLLRSNLKPWRGAYYSFGSVRWYIHNSLTYLARYTFLEFITPTPFNILFYRLMGMKIGKDAQLNTTNISDPSLIEIGDRATVGGSATIIAHYASSGFLVIAPTRIGKGATIGLKVTIMGGVQIGEYASVLPNSVVMPKTVIPDGEVWGGVPAVPMGVREKKKAA